MSPSGPVNPPDHATPSDRAARQDDRWLQQALRQTGAASAGVELDALQARVLEQWRVNHVARHGAHHLDGRASSRPQAPTAGEAAAEPAGAASPRSRLSLWHGHRRAWVGTAGLAAAALAVAVFVGRADPALDELMQPDVLSQLAIGEM